MLVTCRIRPLLPVMQKRQPTASRPASRRKAHRAAAARFPPSARRNSTSRREPSLPACSDRTRPDRSAVRGGHGVAQRQRQEVLGVAPPRAWSSGWPCSQTRMSRPRCTGRSDRPAPPSGRARRCAAPAAGSVGSRAAACLVQRLALQPDAHEPAAMHGQGIEGGETLVEVGVAHGERGGRRHVLVAWPVQSSELMIADYALR